MNFDEEFSELLILKTILKNKDYLTLLTSPFEPKYFTNPNIGKVFAFLK